MRPGSTATAEATTPPPSFVLDRSTSTPPASPRPLPAQAPPSPPHSAGSRSATTASPSRLDHDVRCALQAVRRLHANHEHPAEAQRFRLAPTQFETLQQAIFNDNRLGRWADDKLRWTYDAAAGEFTLPGMPGLLHETCCTELRALLGDKLHALGALVETSRIRPGGQPTLALDGSGSRQPDICFMHEHARRRLPPFVAEVAVTQRGSVEFPCIAEQYLLGSHGRIRTFLGIDVHYQNGPVAPEWARVYLWRFGIDRDTNDGVAEPHLDEQGVAFYEHGQAAEPDARIALSLADFCPRRKRDATAAYPSISITHQELADILTNSVAAANPVADQVIPSDEEELPSPVGLKYRHNKRRASSEPEGDNDNEDSALNATDTDSSFDPRASKPQQKPERKKTKG
jgi:hypothetical protein